MSERRTAEIKFRCTPSFKAEAEAEAEAVGQSLTAYVEAAVRARRSARRAEEVVGGAWERANQQLDGTALVDNAIESLRERGAGKSAAVARLESATPKCSAGGKAICAFAECNGGTTCSPRSDSGEIPPVVDPKVPPGLLGFISTNVGESGPLTEEALARFHASVLNPPVALGRGPLGVGAPIRPGLQPLDAPSDDVAPCGCRPYEFCAHKAKA